MCRADACRQRAATPPEIAHHAVRVLRLRAGAPIVLFDGSGGEYRARLRTEGRVATALVEAYDPVERESPLGLVLVQALPAGDKLDWIVEKAVELGVSAIVPMAPPGPPNGEESVAPISLVVNAPTSSPPEGGESIALLS